MYFSIPHDEQTLAIWTWIFSCIHLPIQICNFNLVKKVQWSTISCNDNPWPKTHFRFSYIEYLFSSQMIIKKNNEHLFWLPSCFPILQILFIERNVLSLMFTIYAKWFQDPLLVPHPPAENHCYIHSTISEYETVI